LCAEQKSERTNGEGRSPLGARKWGWGDVSTSNCTHGRSVRHFLVTRKLSPGWRPNHGRLPANAPLHRRTAPATPERPIASLKQMASTVDGQDRKLQ
jgi:hypothetical protein